MKRNGALDLTAEQKAVALQILQQHLPADALVWVFGTRARGQARPYSDLDLAIDAGRCLSLAETGDLAEAFSESDLPWKVDVVDWRALEPRLASLIEAELVPLVA